MNNKNSYRMFYVEEEIKKNIILEATQAGHAQDLFKKQYGFGKLYKIERLMDKERLNQNMKSPAHKAILIYETMLMPQYCAAEVVFSNNKYNFEDSDSWEFLDDEIVIAIGNNYKEVTDAGLEEGKKKGLFVFKDYGGGKTSLLYNPASENIPVEEFVA